MTLLSRRKHRTTVRSITPGTAAANAALLLALFAAPTLAQPPGTQPTGLPFPPDYHPRTPPQTQPQAQPVRPSSGAMPRSGGTVMNFQKPTAGAVTATGSGLPAAGVAQVNDPGRSTSFATPDVPMRPSLPPSPPQPGLPSSADRLHRQPPTVTATAATVSSTAQPGDVTSTSDKKQEFKPPPVDPKEIQLPSRDKIFGSMFNDDTLEKAIVDAVKAAETKAGRKIDPATFVFPPLPEVSPRGLSYQPKTLTYAPRTLHIEPGYVIHRRLHFEGRNAERQGWDLGPLSTLVAAGGFYRDVLLWPQSLASGAVHGFWDTSAGKCLPGSPSPYYLYPPGLTLTGTTAEAGIIAGAAILFP